MSNDDLWGYLMEFKDKVFQARMQLELSQDAFAKLMKVGVATVCRWENGKTNPSKMAMYKFSKLCDEKGIKFEAK